MKYKKFQNALVTFAIIMIPVATLLFGLKESPFDYTLSMIGNWFEYQTNFIIWGIVTATLISIALINIYKKTKFKNRKAYWFLYLSAFFLILTVIIPTIYDEPIPKELRQAFYFNLHGAMGVFFALFLIASLYLFSKYLSMTDKEMSIKSMKWLFITVGGSILTLTTFGMTGVFEIFFFISLSVFLFIITKSINKKYKNNYKNKPK